MWTFFAVAKEKLRLESNEIYNRSIAIILISDVSQLPKSKHINICNNIFINYIIH